MPALSAEMALVPVGAAIPAAGGGMRASVMLSRVMLESARMRASAAQAFIATATETGGRL